MIDRENKRHEVREGWMLFDMGTRGHVPDMSCRKETGQTQNMLERFLITLQELRIRVERKTPCLCDQGQGNTEVVAYWQTAPRKTPKR